MRAVPEVFEENQPICSMKIMQALRNSAKFRSTNVVETHFAEGVKEKSEAFRASGGEIYREV